MEPWLIEKLLLTIVLLAMSGFFSGTETALFSLSRIKREAIKNRNEPNDRAVLRLLGDSRRLMVNIIVCNELVNVSISTLMAGIGEHAAERFGVHQHLWITVGTAAVTVPLVVLVGDMTPKTLAIRLGDRWARVAARPLEVFSVLVTPLRLLVQLVSESLLRIFGTRPAVQAEGLREEEFRALVDVGEQEGEVEKAERKLIHNVFEFGDRGVVEVMTRAEEVFALPYEMPLGRIVEAVSTSRYSRVPIYRRAGKTGSGAGAGANLGHVVGVLFAKDLVGYARGHLEGRALADLIKPPFFVPKSTKCDRLFREFQRRKIHMALVVDEYGRLVGLVTMEDLLEELFGEIADEKESPARPSDALRSRHTTLPPAPGTPTGTPTKGST